MVKRRVSVRGAIMIGGEKIQVGLAHAGKTAEITVEADSYQINVEPGITIAALRTTSRDIRRHKASNYSLRYRRASPEGAAASRPGLRRRWPGRA
jgi:hypothetical protein